MIIKIEEYNVHGRKGLQVPKYLSQRIDKTIQGKLNKGKWK